MFCVMFCYMIPPVATGSGLELEILKCLERNDMEQRREDGRSNIILTIIILCLTSWLE